MRVLFSFIGGSGHFLPLVPFARAVESAGHTVAFASGHSMTASVEAAGFTVFPLGTPQGDPPRKPLEPVNLEQELAHLRDQFADRAARRRSADMIALGQDWKPDLMVCDEVDFGSMIAAEVLGIPHASVPVIAAGSFVRPAMLAAPLNAIRTGYGLPSDPDLVILSRYLVLSPFPPSYRDPAYPLPATAYSIRPAAPDPQPASSIPAIVKYLPDAPTVYFTLGTVFNIESGDLFWRVLDALKDLELNLIMTVGPYIDPAEFGAQPPHIRIEQYIPQFLILPDCDLVISHGGSGSVMGALMAGLPMVLIPMGADQPLNGDRCQALGIAEVLDPITATLEIIKQTAQTVLSDPRYRQAAGQLRDEIAALPETSSAVPLLEQLAAERLPLINRQTG